MDKAEAGNVFGRRKTSY